MSILIVEDDATMGEMLEFNIRRAGYEVCLVCDGISAIREASMNKPKIILLDLMIPEMDGFSVCCEIKKRLEHTIVIMLTAMSQQEAKLKGFEAGADDYITKPFSMEELLARLKANMKRFDVSSKYSGVGEKIAFGDLLIEGASFRVKVNGKYAKLSAKEFQLLYYMAKNPEKILSRQHLAKEVWGFEYLGFSRTIDAHVKTLRQKVEGRSDYFYIHTVRGVGYMFNPSRKANVQT